MPATIYKTISAQFQDAIVGPMAADGAIVSPYAAQDPSNAPAGFCPITKGSAAALTLAAPLAGGPDAQTAGQSSQVGDDGKRLIIFSTTAFAHAITAPANKINGDKAVATFSADANNYIILEAYQGVWYVIANVGATLT